MCLCVQESAECVQKRLQPASKLNLQKAYFDAEIHHQKCTSSEHFQMSCLRRDSSAIRARFYRKNSAAAYNHNQRRGSEKEMRALLHKKQTASRIAAAGMLWPCSTGSRLLPAKMIGRPQIGKQFARDSTICTANHNAQIGKSTSSSRHVRVCVQLKVPTANGPPTEI